MLVRIDEFGNSTRIQMVALSLQWKIKDIGLDVVDGLLYWHLSRELNHN